MSELVDRFEVGHLLDRQSSEVRARIVADRSLGLEPHEETLTQNFVSAYARAARHAGLRTRVKEFTKYQESHLYGADLAIWFQALDGKLSGIHLQAKRLFRDDTYRGLDHSSKQGRQFDLLVDGARASRASPAYAFYNGLSAGLPLRGCPRGVMDADRNGISFAPAESIRPYLAWRVPRVEIEEHCSPLSCLTLCPRVPVTSSLATAMSFATPFFDRAIVIAADEAPEYLRDLLEYADRQPDEDREFTDQAGGPFTSLRDRTSSPDPFDEEESTASVVLVTATD